MDATKAMDAVNRAFETEAPVEGQFTPERREIRVRIYCCGGTGMKNGLRFRHNSQKDGLRHLDFAFLDTSDSDLPAGVPAEELHLFRGIEGGGKDRQYAYQQVAPKIPEALQKFPPADFNIILHSGSGASGPSIGPALVAQLMEQNKFVLVIQTGSVGSKKEVTNTIGSFRTYANFAEDFGRPVLKFYREANETTTRKQVDEDVQSALMLCAMLFSSENRGIDTKDLEHLIDYHKVTSFRPELSSFEFHSREISLPENAIPQAAAVLYSNDENFENVREVNTYLEYRADGFMSPIRSKQLGDRLPIYFVAFTGDLKERLAGLERRRQGFEAIEQARSNQNASVATTGGDRRKGSIVF